MRALVMHRHGGPEVLTLERDWPDPIAGPGEIVVTVRACALNFLDIFTREGMPGEPTPLPHITGGDIAGIVLAVGEDVTNCLVGDRVVLNPAWGCGVCEYCRDGLMPRCLRGHMLGETEPGGLAEYTKCPAAQAIVVPRAYPLDDAACLPITFGTAWRMIVTRAKVQPTDVVVVLGVGGGVAIAALQIAKLVGARVIATASSDEKLARASTFGADDLINYVANPDWDVAVRTLTGKRGADVIVDTVGASTWQQSIRALGKGGRLVTAGATSGPIGETDIRYLFRREQMLVGSNGWTHNELLRVTSLAFEGKVRPVIDRIVPLDLVAESELLLERRQVFGKIVVHPGVAGAA
jgi:NADPH:quinone reductase-like Zn-dependent oxidoreductase